MLTPTPGDGAGTPPSPTVPTNSLVASNDLAAPATRAG